MIRNTSILFACFLSVVLMSSAAAAERIVQLDVPGCRPCGAAKRIESIIKKIKAVQNIELKAQTLLIVTYDDNKGCLDQIIDELKKGGFAVRGNPVFLK